MAKLGPWLVAGIGLVVFIALLFANRTVLDNDAPPPQAEPTPTPGTERPPMSGGVDIGKEAPDTVPLRMPPLQLSPEQIAEANRLIQAYEDGQTDAQRRAALAAVVNFHAQVGELAQAGRFQAELAELTQAPEDFRKAAEYFRDEYERQKRALPKPIARSLNAAAIRYYKRYLAANPKDKPTEIELAVRQVNSETPMVGILKLRNIVAEDSLNYTAQYYLGSFAEQTRQLDKAEQRFRMALQARPNDSLALYGLGRVLAAQPTRKPEAQAILGLARNQFRDENIRAQIARELRALN